MNVLELHGNLQRVKCSACGEQATAWDESGPDVPQCSWCGGLLRPDVVWFGEMLPFEALRAADEALESCDLFLSIGTSSVVQPAASFIQIAAQNGATTVEINPEPTPISRLVDFSVRGKAGEVLPRLVDAR